MKVVSVATFLFSIAYSSSAYPIAISSNTDNEVVKITQHILMLPDLSAIDVVATELGISVAPQEKKNVFDFENNLIGKSQNFVFLKSSFKSLGFTEENFKAGTFSPIGMLYVRAWFGVNVNPEFCPIEKSLFLSTFDNARVGFMHDATPPVYYVDGGGPNEITAGFVFSENGCLKELGFSQNMHKEK